jgi:hypothetical protein
MAFELSEYPFHDRLIGIRLTSTLKSMAILERLHICDAWSSAEHGLQLTVDETMVRCGVDGFIVRGCVHELEHS